MKHLFLLDENILYLAVKGVDEHGQPDLTSSDLLERIGQNCHRVFFHAVLADKYWGHLSQLKLEGSFLLDGVVRFIVQFMKNFDKQAWSYEELPNLPEGVVVPREDLHVARIALLTSATLVSCDKKLRDSINNRPDLWKHAVTPQDALAIAADT